MLSALAIAQDVEGGRISVEAALKLGDENIARFEADIRALVCSNGKRPGAERTGPLSGIAIGIKDIFDTFDMPTEHGSSIYEGHQPKRDAVLVSMLRQQGAHIACKTVTTEFAFFAPGPTRNPHNLDYSPGGSSSGSAAGVAAGYFPAAIGSQTGGSIIRPASYCGVAGYKPSFDLFSPTGAKCFSWSLDTVGFFAASVADVAFVAASCSGFDVDVGSAKGSPRIGVYRSHLFDEASGDMQNALVASAALAQKAGAIIVEITPINALNRAHDAHVILQNHEAAIACAGEYAQCRGQMSDKLKDALEMGQGISKKDYLAAQEIAKHARMAVGSLFENVDVVLTLSAPDIAPLGIETTGEPLFNKLWTLLGTPCVNVPGLVNGENMPLGMQIIAPYGQDKKALWAANWLEQVLR